MFSREKSRGSIAFEYVVVTLVGVGISLVVMQFAKKTMSDKMRHLRMQLEESFDEQWTDGSSGDFGDDF